jgi:hypothetical protein
MAKVQSVDSVQDRSKRVKKNSILEVRAYIRSLQPHSVANVNVILNTVQDLLIYSGSVSASNHIKYDNESKTLSVTSGTTGYQWNLAKLLA